MKHRSAILLTTILIFLFLTLYGCSSNSDSVETITPTVSTSDEQVTDEPTNQDIAESEDSSEDTNTVGNIDSTPVLVDVYSDDNCLIQFYTIEKESDNSIVAKFRTTNHTGRTLTFQSDCIAFNGESTNNIRISDDVAPNSAGTIEVGVSDIDTKYFDLSNIYKISGNFRVIDFGDDDFDTYSAEYINIEIPNKEHTELTVNNGFNLYEDEKVAISFLHTEEDEDDTNVWLRVKNNTKEVITIQCSSMALNGESATDIHASEAIAPNSTGNVSIGCEIDQTFVNLDVISKISGTLKIIAFNNDDFHNGKQSYSVTFEKQIGETTQEPTPNSDQPNVTTEAESAWSTMLNLDVDDLTTSNSGKYLYKNLHLREEDIVEISGKTYIDYGAMYNSIAKSLGVLCENDGFLFGNMKNEVFQILIGEDRPASWKDFKSQGQYLYSFIQIEAPETTILKAFEPLTCVEGNFDYDARTYDFTITDLAAAAKELTISEEMLGYIIAYLCEYPAEVVFDGNTMTFSLTVETYD